ncbi:Vacuolar calcium ion transporter [Apiospora phragmitis]|uniref:Vacuolar calcium ion transporter n=1 Tax=Apiospora phragmitis TaxID=2905665 RepID=A0ABR1X7H4_9PEZI
MADHEIQSLQRRGTGGSLANLSQVNLISSKSQARKEGKDGWNPFGHIHHGSRSRTLDVESGNGNRNSMLLAHSQTVPDRLPSSHGHSDSRTSKENEAIATSDGAQPPIAPHPDAATDGSSVRNRKANGVAEGDGVGHEEDKSKKKKKKDHALFKHVQPKEPYTVSNQLRRTILGSWINILLVAAPVGIAMNYTGFDGKIIFAVNFIAIIPLANMLSNATEEIALRTGETLGGLINATFGNAVELIVAVIALIHKEYIIVQTSLIGSILSNLLLVLGMCFFFGGINRPKQSFNQVVAQTAASLLALAVASNIIPTVFKQNVYENEVDNHTVDDRHVAAISRGVSVILLFVYCCYLYFQLKTHADVFNETSEKTATYASSSNNVAQEGVHGTVASIAVMAATTAGPQASQARQNASRDGDDEEEDDDEDPQLHFWVAIAQLTISTVIIALCAEFMVDGISAVTTEGGLSEEFVGLILLPIVGNAAEHATAVTVAIKDKMDLAIGVAVGSSMQVSLFLLPLLIIIGWGMGAEEMTLAFDTFQIVVLFLSVLLVNYLIGDGESHWLEGVLLMCLYIIIAVCAWFYPAAPGTVA